jgi:hypothetical protein
MQRQGYDLQLTRYDDRAGASLLGSSLETYASPGFLSPRPQQTSDAKQGETDHEQLKRRWHLHRVAREIDGHVGSSGRRHREDNQKHRKEGA